MNRTEAYAFHLVHVEAALSRASGRDERGVKSRMMTGDEGRVGCVFGWGWFFLSLKTQKEKNIPKKLRDLTMFDCFPERSFGVGKM